MNTKIAAAFLILFFCLGYGVFAQGNLQFNQAIKLDLVGIQSVGVGSNYHQVAIQTINVPVGKVWKIESTNANITKGQYTTSTYAALFNWAGTPIIYMDDVIIYSSVVSTDLTVPHQIYWLPAGTHTFSLWLPTVSSAVAYSYTASITAIEFNVVP
jgi:hypothetical protein